MTTGGELPQEDCGSNLALGGTVQNKFFLSFCLTLLKDDGKDELRDGLTKYTSTFWIKKNIRCNAVAFGGVYNKQKKAFVKKISKLIPMGRMAHENEYNSTIIYLISDASSYMNGAVVVVDGGRTAW